MNITIDQIEEAAKRLEGVIAKTPLLYLKRLSQKFEADIYIKREDLQEVRSFKIRGAYNKIASLTQEERKNGIVTASTGNHAQGVAYSCALLNTKGIIFMPTVTPNQKLDKVKQFGGNFVEIILTGDTFDESVKASLDYCQVHSSQYIHPFDDPVTIAGQGTIGKEIFETLGGKVDIVLSPVGGGGLASGIASYLKQKRTGINIYGVEAEGAASMEKSLKTGKVVSLGKFDTFVDGAAVNRVGEITFTICKKYLEQVLVTPVGNVCTTMIELYQNEGIIAEPAGTLSVSALELIKEKIIGKTVVCILSGGNNDILRYPEIMERSLVYQGKKHYFIIDFAQKPGQLRKFVDQALGPNDDIVRFEYIKKTNKEKAPALVGIELRDSKDLDPLLNRMKEIELNFTKLTSDNILSEYLI